MEPLSLHLFVFVLGLVLLLLAGLKVSEPERPRFTISYGWMGLFLLAVSTLIKI